MRGYLAYFNSLLALFPGTRSRQPAGHPVSVSLPLISESRCEPWLFAHHDAKMEAQSQEYGIGGEQR